MLSLRPTCSRELPSDEPGRASAQDSCFIPLIALRNYPWTRPATPGTGADYKIFPAAFGTTLRILPKESASEKGKGPRPENSGPDAT